MRAPQPQHHHHSSVLCSLLTLQRDHHHHTTRDHRNHHHHMRARRRRSLQYVFSSLADGRSSPQTPPFKGQSLPRSSFKLQSFFVAVQASSFKVHSFQGQSSLLFKLQGTSSKMDAVGRSSTAGAKYECLLFGSWLGLEDCFEGIICFETLNPHIEPVGSMAAPDENTLPAGDGNGMSISSKSKILCKPSVEAIEAAIQIANVNPKTTIFFDDSARNIASGKAAGLQTVIVGSTEPVPGADHALSSIHNIKEALPEIWEGEEGKQLEQVIQSTSVKTVVLA